MAIPSSVPREAAEALSGRYDLQREIGRGGMATVFLARDLKHGRDVAVKILRPDLSASIGTDRFLREIEIAASLTHPHILPLHDSGDANGLLYYVMPYIAGESLRRMLLRRKRLAHPEALAVAREVAGALTYAHRRGVIHRDIKPENVLLAEGHAVVADFGIAKAISTAGGTSFTRSGFPLGTPGYMSPEQAAGSTGLDESSDVFSLGCVCYEMLVGDTPGLFVSHDAERMRAFVDAPTAHREQLDMLPGSLEQALVKAMALRPRDRFPTPDDFIDALDRAGTGPRYTPSEIRAIVGRAALEDDSDDSLTLGSVQRIAAEAGIAPRNVLREAWKLEAPDPQTRPRALLGVEQKVVLEHRIPGEASPELFPEILEDIRHALGEVGRINETMGRSLSWNSLSFQNSPMGMGRLTHVTVTPKHGETRIRVTEASGQHTFVSAGLAILTGILAATAGTAVFQLSDISPLFALGTGLAGASGAHLVLRAAMKRFIRRRIETLTDVVNRIATHAVRDTDPGQRTPNETEQFEQVNSKP